ncbi:MAG TPA: hypothetical protein VHW01_12520 [Polyangiaceae bacterium]|jgi:hypothetical protein|nr:hypothetical protein [Polyangiaceae bacterium]
MGRSDGETRAINRELGNHGLGQLGDGGLMAQLGFLVADHTHFRALLNKCEPTERVAMYNALRPNLSFTAKPLDVYISELGDIAERKQLPTVTPEGTFAPFRPAEIKTGELAVAQNAIAHAVARVWLEVVCARCTRTEHFPGVTAREAESACRAAHWVWDRERDEEICPACQSKRDER